METNLKDIAAGLIYSSGGEDIEFMTIVETLEEQFESEGIDIGSDETEALANKIHDLIARATICVSWTEDSDEYVFGVRDEGC